MNRPFLVWVSTSEPRFLPSGAQILSENREYDVFWHNYKPAVPVSEFVQKNAEYIIEQEGEKLNIAGRDFTNPLVEDVPWWDYEAVAFLDDDLTFTPAALNLCFEAGVSHGLDIWQPALTLNSIGSHNHLFQSVFPAGKYRAVPFVEIMMPFFSQRVLPQVLQTFTLNESGWGLDCYVWPKIAQGYVIDDITFGHYREPARRERLLRNGLTPAQECWIQQRIFTEKPPGYEKAVKYELESQFTVDDRRV